MRRESVRTEPRRLRDERSERAWLSRIDGESFKAKIKSHVKIFEDGAFVGSTYSGTTSIELFQRFARRTGESSEILSFDSYITMFKPGSDASRTLQGALIVAQELVHLLGPPTPLKPPSAASCALRARARRARRRLDDVPPPPSTFVGNEAPVPETPLKRGRFIMFTFVGRQRRLTKERQRSVSPLWAPLWR